MSSAKVIHWGILATGGIARTFTKDLLIDPTTRKVTDIKHVVVATASSSSLSSAERFISDVVAPSQSAKCTPYGSYEDLVKDSNVDIVYIATPHSHHYQNAMLCLSNNKPVLCEKALTVNAAQAKIIYEKAKEKNLFFMEAVWTRYFPLSSVVRKHIMDNDIGEVTRVFSDLSIGVTPETAFDLGNRMVNLDLAGGCLLDLGIYSLTWIFQSLYHTLPAALREEGRPKVLGTGMTPEPRTGADESTLILLEFPKSTPGGKTKAHAIATTAMRVSDDPGRGQGDVEVPAVRIQGDQGEIQVYGPIYRPMRYRLVPKDRNREVIDRRFEFEGGAHGMMYEADAAARALLSNALESENMPWAESTLIMEIMDEVRRQGGLVYPEAIESTEYPVKLGART
ncbi:uncharacterized protein Z518_11237 [Rhinocladiella mackenziei CBS 650.93]|uniref:D-xylose 1-dehydrogenase (NADP(+), D-xylono-1,5-lactone-forming) n=1 Tax=Rhinocladiella mackenziei CBS 650.93 TaxID=1442369 RepID=A0A0D2I1D5_9EURO|nr:uncharacterized protein Z518_11237 [Rhinocladiella mackenziei CBS 650.93]KIW99498.1 hypothetical protein Z518_11237 [Rhinocladiella mackenziei CBS 650.93]